MSTATPDNPNQNEPTRLERELDEILNRTGANDLKPPPRPRPQSGLRSIQGGKGVPRGFTLPRFQGGAAWMIGGLFLAIFAVLVDDISPLLANLLALTAVIAFLMPIFQSFRRPTAPPQQKMWRGQVLEVDPPPQANPIDQVKQWWNHRMHRP